MARRTASRMRDDSRPALQLRRKIAERDRRRQRRERSAADRANRTATR